MKGSAGLRLPNARDTLLLKAAIHSDQKGLEAWRRLQPSFSLDVAHAGQLSLMPLVHQTLCAMDAPDPDRERLAGQRRFFRARWARMVGLLSDGLCRLETEGIPCMLVGEAARAQRIDGEDRSLRDLNIVDLLVPPGERERAGALLDQSHPIRLVRKASDRLADPSSGLDRAWEEAESLTWVSCLAYRPCPTDLLLYTLVDGIRFSHAGRIRWAADAALLIDEGGIHWDRLQEEAERRRVAVTVATALSYLNNALDVPLPRGISTEAPRGMGHSREVLINRLWSDRSMEPCCRNAVVLALAQSADKHPINSLLSLSPRFAKVAACELRQGLQIFGRIRLPPPLFGIGQDQPAPLSFTRSVVVASMPRSGSTLLCSALERTGLVGVPLEYLLPRFFESGHRVMGVPRPTRAESWKRMGRRLCLQKDWFAYREIVPSTLPAYIKHTVACRTTANGVFALKVHWQHFVEALAMGFEPDQNLPMPITWICLDRKDRIAQSVSYVKAMQTGVFARRKESRQGIGRTRYDDDALCQAWQLLQHGTCEWSSYFREHGITPIRVWYEDLAADYEGTLTRVLEALGFKGVPVPPAIHQRQADSTTAQWIAAFRRNHPELTRCQSCDDGHRGQP